jgi:iron(III) transport system substrate-binding protein
MSRSSMFIRPAAATAGLLTSLVMLSACSSAPNTATASQEPYAKSMQEACEAGQSEGELNYWSATDPEDFEKEIEPFRVAYPGIKVNFTSIRPTDATQKIITEIQANHPLDVDATSTDLPSAQPLFDRHSVAQVDWSKLDIPENLRLDYGGVGIYRTLRDFIGIGYNSERTPAADLPSTWAELVDPKYKEQIVVDPRGVYLSGLAIAWGQDKTVDWVKDLMKTTNPVVTQGATDSIQKVISGESTITTSAVASAINAAKHTGAPMDIAYLDVVTSQDKYGVVLAGAQHPNAAACFLGWFGSPEGQAQQLAIEYKDNADRPAGVPAGAEVAVALTPEQQAIFNTTGEAISEAISK